MTTSESKGRFFLQNESIGIDSRNVISAENCSISVTLRYDTRCRFNVHAKANTNESV